MNDRHAWRAGSLLAASLLAAATAPAAAADVQRWRITHSMAASGPEAQPAVSDDDRRLLGRTVIIETARLSGPAPFTCEPTALETDTVPLAQAFDAAIPEPPEGLDAQRLGLAGPEVTRTRVACPNADFDYVFVQADADTRLFALNGRIWSLSRTPGSEAAADSPSGVIQRLLEAHFQSDRGWLAHLLTGKRRWFSAALDAATTAYFARPRPADEVPPIDSDAFSNSQESPPRFAVGTALIEGDLAWVPVRFADSGTAWTLRYRLLREAGRWMLGDIALAAADARSLRQILEQD